MRLNALIIFAIILLPTLLRAQEQLHRSQIAAANANAVDALKRDIYRVPLDNNLTVKDLIDKTGSDADLTQTLQRAEQVGGPRWLDDSTCQVRLEIAGVRVARTLMQIATIAHERTPIQADALRFRLKPIESRTFTATGTSTGASGVENVRPAGDELWSTVPEDARRTAINDARADAVTRIINSLRPLEIAPDHTIGSDLDAPRSALKTALLSYLNDRPVTAVDFRQDRQVQLTLAASPMEVSDVISRSLGLVEPKVTHLRQQICQRMAAPMGVGRLGAPAATAVSLLQLPTRPPEWVDRQLQADGTGRVPGSRLLSLRKAEADASAKLQSQISALRLTPTLTMADAARQDRRLAEAVSRAVGRARTYKITDNPDGSLTVRMSLEMVDLWSKLRNSP